MREYWKCGEVLIVIWNDRESRMAQHNIMTDFPFINLAIGEISKSA